MTMTWRQHAPWIAAGAAILVLLWLLAPILAPFVVGAALAYLGDPLVDRMQRWGLSRSMAVSVVFVVLGLAGLLALILIVPALYRQIVELVHNIPEWLRWIQQQGLPRLGLTLPEGMALDPDSLKRAAAEHWQDAGNLASRLWGSVSKSGGALLTAVANLLMVPVVSFYLLRDWDALVAWIRGMIPPRLLPKSTELARETDTVLGAFLRGQLSVMAALAVLYSVGLALCGLKLALVIGLMAGLLSFIPYLGFAVGFAAASLAMLAQTQELLPLLWVALVFGIGQVVESAFLTPNLVGDKIGLHPVTVIFAVLAGGQLFGFVGVLAALPVAAVLSVLLRHAKQHWLESPTYLHGAQPPDPPPPPPPPLP